MAKQVGGNAMWTDEQIEAGAKAFWTAQWGEGLWEIASERGRERGRCAMRKALEAVASVAVRNPNGDTTVWIKSGDIVVRSTPIPKTTDVLMGDEKL